MLTVSLLPKTECAVGVKAGAAVPTYGVASWTLRAAVTSTDAEATLALEGAVSEDGPWVSIATKPLSVPGIVTLAGDLGAYVYVRATITVTEGATVVAVNGDARFFDPALAADKALLGKNLQGFTTGVDRIARHAEADLMDLLTVRGPMPVLPTKDYLAAAPVVVGLLFDCWGPTRAEVIERAAGRASTVDTFDFDLSKPGAVDELKLEIARQAEHLHQREFLSGSTEATAIATLRDMPTHIADLGSRLKRFRNRTVAYYAGR